MSRFDALVADPFSVRRYLAILEPYDPSVSATIPLYLSDHGFATEPADSPSNRYFDARLLSALSFERHLYRSGELGGRSVPGFGTLDVNNADGGLDHWRDLAFDGRRVRLLLGGNDFRLAEYRTVFDGTAERIEFDDDRVRLHLRDLQVLFERPLQENLYQGTGGMEGGAGLSGRTKPLCYGRCFHVPAVLVEGATLTYQVHDGPVGGIDAVFDSGVALTPGSSPPDPGHFSTDLAAGTFRLGSAPAGPVTADVRGDASAGAYVEDVGSLLIRIAMRAPGLTDIDWTAFADLTIAAPMATGFFASEATDLLAALDALADAAGAHFGFDRSGRFTAGRLDEPETEAAESFDETAILGLEREPAALPFWRLRLGYGRHWRPLSEGESAASLGAGARTDLAEHFRYAETSDGAIRTRHRLARDLQQESLIATGADAAAEALRRLTLFGTARDLFRVRVKTRPYSLALGTTILLRYPRHGLDDGRNLVLVGLAEDSAYDEAELTLWG
ncbi:hypothetical protein NUH88_08925 [Nisaea acidiphila]|uniref:Uncharacterized protein n=1 Tax=Nisaea acidiphila TaxID=1862145 RepID=A0A9J7AYE3_9PROT|nr:hypothetical protein [Nisaea acidiphila]UUX51810.1 hypothetical protein NUH88_08925 [Nisaea acidiphila]